MRTVKKILLLPLYLPCLFVFWLASAAFPRGGRPS